MDDYNVVTIDKDGKTKWTNYRSEAHLDENRARIQSEGRVILTEGVNELVAADYYNNGVRQSAAV